jgi:hypothetical protein
MRKCLIHICVLSLFLFACKGPIGPTGPTGSLGPAGPQGDPGVVQSATVTGVSNGATYPAISAILEFPPAVGSDVDNPPVITAFVQSSSTDNWFVVADGNGFNSPVRFVVIKVSSGKWVVEFFNLFSGDAVRAVAYY